MHHASCIMHHASCINEGSCRSTTSLTNSRRRPAFPCDPQTSEARPTCSGTQAVRARAARDGPAAHPRGRQFPGDSSPPVTIHGEMRLPATGTADLQCTRRNTDRDLQALVTLLWVPVDRPTPNKNRLTVIRFSCADQVPDGDSNETSPRVSGSGNPLRSNASSPASIVGMIMRQRRRGSERTPPSLVRAASWRPPNSIRRRARRIASCPARGGAGCPAVPAQPITRRLSRASGDRPMFAGRSGNPVRPARRSCSPPTAGATDGAAPHRRGPPGCAARCRPFGRPAPRPDRRRARP